MIWFNDYTTTPTAVNAIEAVTYQNGGYTYTHRALKQIYARMVDPAVSGMLEKLLTIFFPKGHSQKD